MKRFNLGAMFALLVGVISTPALAQEAESLDAKVNAIFATVTGPFVSLIFALIPGTSFP